MTESIFKREYKGCNAKEKLAMSGLPFWRNKKTKYNLIGEENHVLFTFFFFEEILFTLLYKLFSFISIGEVFNFRNKVYLFSTYYFKY